jgi:aryl-alcohol dehydrogenase-like predicted oxidoreductase
MGGQDDADSIAAIHAAVDHGVNWIDTAPIYGSGHSESVVSTAVKALPASRRPMIFSKFGLGDNGLSPNRAASRTDVLKECEARASRGSAWTASICISSTGRRRSRSPKRPAHARRF